MNIEDLTSESLHIWHIPLSPASNCNRLIEELSKEEQARASKFAEQSLREHYILAHSAVRHILTGYLGIAPAQLQLTTTKYGKPVLQPGLYPLDLQFNLSHCRNLALLAVTLGRKVGVDLEHLDIPRKTEPLTRRYFTDQIIQVLSTLPADQRKIAFLRLWTQFEAYKKALGTGLRGRNEKFEFSHEDAPQNLFQPLKLQHDQNQWHSAQIAVPQRWVASIVVKDRPNTFKLRHLEYEHPDSINKEH